MLRSSRDPFFASVSPAADLKGGNLHFRYNGLGQDVLGAANSARDNPVTCVSLDLAKGCGWHFLQVNNSDGGLMVDFFK